MSTPGFTAEASLTERSEPYRMATQGPSPANVVEPAGPLQFALCINQFGGAWWAWTIVCPPLLGAPGP